MKPEVTKTSGIDMQVCVPKEWSDIEVIMFAQIENPCGTEGGWQIRKEGSEYLAGSAERVVCKDREGFVHI